MVTMASLRERRPNRNKIELRHYYPERRGAPFLVLYLRYTLGESKMEEAYPGLG